MTSASAEPAVATTGKRGRGLVITVWSVAIVLFAALALRPIYGPPLAAVLLADAALPTLAPPGAVKDNLRGRFWLAMMLDPDAKWIRELRAAVVMEADARAPDGARCGADLAAGSTLLRDAGSSVLLAAAARCFARHGEPQLAVATYERSIDVKVAGETEMPAPLRPWPTVYPVPDTRAAYMLIAAGAFYELPGDVAVNRRVARALYVDASRASPAFIARVRRDDAKRCAHGPRYLWAAICAYGAE